MSDKGLDVKGGGLKFGGNAGFCVSFFLGSLQVL